MFFPEAPRSLTLRNRNVLEYPIAAASAVAISRSCSSLVGAISLLVTVVVQVSLMLLRNPVCWYTRELVTACHLCLPLPHRPELEIS